MRIATSAREFKSTYFNLLAAGDICHIYFADFVDAVFESTCLRVRKIKQAVKPGKTRCYGTKVTDAAAWADGTLALAPAHEIYAAVQTTTFLAQRAGAALGVRFKPKSAGYDFLKCGWHDGDNIGLGMDKMVDMYHRCSRLVVTSTETSKPQISPECVLKHDLEHYADEEYDEAGSVISKKDPLLVSRTSPGRVLIIYSHCDRVAFSYEKYRTGI